MCHSTLKMKPLNVLQNPIMNDATDYNLTRLFSSELFRINASLVVRTNFIIFITCSLHDIQLVSILPNISSQKLINEIRLNIIGLLRDLQ
jgi:hypothetical protein